MKIAALGPALAVATMLSVASAAAPGAERAAMRVDGHQVSPGEFQWFMELERAEVFRYFKTRFHLEDTPGFWERSCGGTTPGDVLRSNTVARVIREKVEQGAFQQLGLAPDISYEAFLGRFEKTNRERQQAAAQGRAVYGPVRYTQLQFYEQWKSTLRVQAMAKLADQSWRPTESDLKGFYEKNLDMFRGQPARSIEVVTIRGAATNRTEDRGVLQKAASAVLSGFIAGSSLGSVTNQASQGRLLSVSGERYQHLDIDRLGELFSGEQEAQAAWALRPGETKSFSMANDMVRVVRCQGWIPGPQRSYESVSQQVRDRWLTQQYDTYLKRLVSQAQVEVNAEAIQPLVR